MAQSEDIHHSLLYEQFFLKNVQKWFLVSRKPRRDQTPLYAPSFQKPTKLRQKASLLYSNNLHYHDLSDHLELAEWTMNDELHNFRNILSIQKH